MKNYWSLSFLFIVIMLTLSCGGSDYADDGDYDNNARWLRFDHNTAQEVTTAQQSLYGTLFMAESYTCQTCPSSRYGTSLTWENETSGQSGLGHTTYVERWDYIFGCYCSSVWSATASLVYGDNQLTIRGEDLDGTYGEGTISVTRKPPAPSGLEFNPGSGETVVSWQAVADATSYNLYWSNYPDFSPSTANLIQDVQSPYTHESLENSKTYYYRVSALVGDIEGPASDDEWSTTGWSIESIASIETGYEALGTSIDLDLTGNAHIYFAQQYIIGPTAITTNRTYLSSDVDGWLATDMGIGSWPEAKIAVDSKGDVHLLHLGFAGIVHSQKDDVGVWSEEVIDGISGCEVAVALDGADNLHLAYRGDGGIKYATNSSGAWSDFLVVDQVNESGCGGKMSISLATAPDGSIHIAYAERTSEAPFARLRYATDKTGTWIVETADDSYVDSLSIAVDSAGVPHIAYCDNLRQFKFSFLNNGEWVLDFIKTDSFPRMPNLAFDSSGVAHISFIDSGNGFLKYVTNKSGDWVYRSIDNIGSAHMWQAFIDNALVIDDQDYLHISYFNLVNRSLNYATNRPEL